MDIEKFRDMFLVEAAEHLQKMAQLLIQLDNDQHDADNVAALFREAHSIKGMAATMEYHQMARLAHHLEDALDACRKEGTISEKLLDRVLDGLDLLEKLLEDIREGRTERDIDAFLASEEVIIELPDDGLESGFRAVGQGLLVELQLKESVGAAGPRYLVLLKRMADFGRIIESRPSEEQLLGGEVPKKLSIRLESELSEVDIRQRLERYSELDRVVFVNESLEAEQQVRKKPGHQTLRVNTELLDHLINLTGELITNRYHLQSALRQQSWQDIDEGVGRMARLIKNLHHQVLKVRMVSLDNLIGRLARSVFELSRTSGKQVQFNVDCADLELDRTIVDELLSPLTHMVRNAVDHGIEEQGTVTFKAWRERDQVLIQVADDGAGIDPHKIREKALGAGLISTTQADNMRDIDLYQLICSSGFSTAEKVTEVSGRGVGMDVVKTAIEKIGGVLLIDSAVGEGTRITLKLPLSMAIIRVLQVDCGGVCMAIPITRVIQTLEVDPQEIKSSGKQLLIPFQDELLPLLSLRKMLNLAKGARRNAIAIVVTEVFGRRVGLVVDRLVGQREIFLQRLPEPFEQIRGCNGATILGDGSIVFLLDLQSLLEKRRAAA